MTDTAVYEDLRPLLFSIAYRMLGSAGDAEDVVQEAFIRYARAEEEIESPRAWLSAATTRLAIDQLRSARMRREQYVGQWVPEPLLTDEVPGPADDAETADTISLAFLVLLESLSPVERAVFLLREVFAYDYGEIARIVGKSEENCRQIAVRARRAVDARRPRFEASRAEREELARRFIAAAQDGDTEGLIDLLSADVAFYGDGGGKTRAVRHPVYGRENVGKLFAAFVRIMQREGQRLEPAEVNGQPGARFYDRDGALVGVFSLDIADGAVQTVRSIVNPEKLAHLTG
jgi:RNA polymerase sigma-70 factor, ECF subfamily